MKQVNTLSANFRLGLELVDWFRDPTSVAYGYLLIKLSVRIDDRLGYCTISSSAPLKFFMVDR